MADVKEVERMKHRAAAAVSLPVPSLVLPPLPDKIARLDPAGAKAWSAECNRNLADWVKKQNAVSGSITAAIK